MEDFNQLIESVFLDINDKFTAKNTNGYGANNDLLHNFRQMSSRNGFGDYEDGMFKVCELLKDKHNVTIAANGIHTSELEDRLTDTIIYSLFEIYLLRMYNKRIHGQAASE